MPPFLKKKVAGLPLGVWLIIVAAGVGIGIYLRKRNETDEVSEDGEQPEDFYGEDYYGTETGDLYDTVPISALPSEDYGQYPITGGGPPSVPQELALRLQPDTLRIKVAQKRRRKRKNKKKDTDRKPGNYDTTAGTQTTHPVARRRSRRRTKAQFYADNPRDFLIG